MCLLLDTCSCSILSEASLKEMLPSDFRRGLAWWGQDAQYGSPTEQVWQHGGFMQGVRTHMYLWPQHAAALVVLTNGSHDYTTVVKAAVDALQGLAGVRLA